MKLEIVKSRNVGPNNSIGKILSAEDEVEQAMEAIGLVAGGMANDFNNLLTAINGHSELVLRRMRPEDPLTRNLEAIRNAGNRAAALTEQLLAFSRKLRRQD